MKNYVKGSVNYLCIIFLIGINIFVVNKYSDHQDMMNGMTVDIAKHAYIAGCLEPQKNPYEHRLECEMKAEKFIKPIRELFNK